LLKLAREFHSIGGSVQFLPGGFVIVTEDGKSTRYAFRSSGFVTSQEVLAPSLRSWIAFDWEGVDYLDQLNRKDFDPDIRAFLPNPAKVKKVLTLSQPDGTSLLLVCYTSRSAQPLALPEATDISVLAVLDSEKDPHKPAKFQKEWEKKVAANASYGEFELQTVPRVGTFILLYSASTGGDAVDRALSVYRTERETQAHR
jgi:hypothetical protein